MVEKKNRTTMLNTRRQNRSTHKLETKQGRRYVTVFALALLAISLFVTHLPLVVSAEESENIEPGSGSVSYVEAVQRLIMSFTGSDKIAFTAKQDQPVFVKNTTPDFLNEVYFPDLMGRVVIHSIGTHSPVYDDGDNFLSLLDWGAGMVPLSRGESEDYFDSIYLHRVLTKTTGVLYLDEMKKGDPFYVDNYQTGLRNFYHVTDISLTSEVDYMKDHPYYLSGHEYREMLGTDLMLVTCAPFVYGVSTQRILVVGELHSVADIPEDDELYLRYQADHPEQFPPETETAETTQE